MFEVRRAIERFKNRMVRFCAPRTETHDLQIALLGIPQEIGAKGTRFRITTEGRSRPLRATIRNEVYQIGRESLLNAFRHARASQIEAELQFAGHYFGMLIRDDGRGVDAERLSKGNNPNLGLLGMCARAGRIGAQFRLMSGAARGTEIQLLVPGVVAFEPEKFEAPARWLPISTLRRTIDNVIHPDATERPRTVRDSSFTKSLAFELSTSDAPER